MVTRADLVPCPSCRAHLRAAETRCPFCDAAVAGPGARRASAGVRRTMAAATFFGVTAIAACAYGEPPDFDDADPDVVEDVASDVDDVTGADGALGDAEADGDEADQGGAEGR